MAVRRGRTVEGTVASLRMRAETRSIEGHEFWLVGSPQLRRDATGHFQEYTHVLPEHERANAWATGPFCTFGLPSAPPAPGVYAVFVDDLLRYIGECENLSKRFSAAGYGQISPRNCHSDGQSTNCKLNANILAAAKEGRRIDVWFHPTNDFKEVEARLLTTLTPPWNGRRRDASRQTRTPPSTRRAREPAAPSSGPPRNEFATRLSQILQESERSGARSVQVRAGDLHRLVGGYPGNAHRMPVCCSVMRALMGPGDRTVHAPPKGNGASLTIEYVLPRER